MIWRKWHHRREGEMAAIFLTTCLFMLNRPWVTARPWQNKIRVPFCTSVSLSHGIVWQVSWGKYYTLYSMQVYFSPSCFVFYAHSWSHFPFIYLSLYFFLCLFHALFITWCQLPFSLSLFLFPSASLHHLSLSLSIHLLFCLLPSLTLSASLPWGTKVKNTGRI